MTLGIETYRPNGSVAMTGANKAGIFIELLTIQYSSPSGSKVYNQIPAGAIYILPVSSGGQFSIAITDDGLGHAKLVWTKVSSGSPYLNSTAPTEFVVFAKRLNQTYTYGTILYNDDGDQLADFNYPVPQYVTTLQPSATPVLNSYCNGDNVIVRHDHTATLNARPQSNRFIVVNLPDSTNADIWYSCTSFVEAGRVNAQGGYDITVTLTIVRPRGVPYVVPTLHVFALDGPINGGGSYGEQYYTSDGTLVYDSSAENVTISAIQNIVYSNTGTPASYSMNFSGTPGVAIPFFEQDNWVAYSSPDVNGNIGYFSDMRGLVQRKGSTLYTKLYEIQEDPRTGGSTFNTQTGVVTNNFVLAVDVSQLNPSSVTGTPPTAYQ
jgi:hypothetical protein